MKRILFCLMVFAATTLAQEIKDPLREAARKLEKKIKEDNYRDLKNASDELVTLSKEIQDEVGKSGENVMSARIFDKLDKLDKAARKIREKARGPY